MEHRGKRRGWRKTGEKERDGTPVRRRERERETEHK